MKHSAGFIEEMASWYRLQEACELQSRTLPYPSNLDDEAGFVR